MKVFLTLVSGHDTPSIKDEKINLLNVTLVINFNDTPSFAADLPEITIYECPISNTLCTEEKVYDLLSALDVNKANGHDDISARTLKILKSALPLQ